MQHKVENRLPLTQSSCDPITRVIFSSQPTTMSTDQITLNIKGPSELKLSISISPDSSSFSSSLSPPSSSPFSQTDVPLPFVAVSDLKALIASKSDVEASRQRLIYSGKVLKDDEPLTTYKLANSHTVHMVKGAPRNGDPASTASTGASTFGLPAQQQGAAAQRLPTMAAGQQVVGNPLAALEGVQGHGFGGYVFFSTRRPFLFDLNGVGLTWLSSCFVCRGIFNPFEGMGNLNDPNAMANMARSPAVMEQMAHMLENPEVLDQVSLPTCLFDGGTVT